MSDPSTHYDNISTATPLEDWKKMRDKAERELSRTSLEPVTSEQLAVAAAACATLGQDVPPERPLSPMKSLRIARRKERRKSLRSSWINDATVGMLGRGWKP